MLKPRFEISPESNQAEFSTTLSKWFTANGRSYPWRQTRDPWAILVSEVMLQQTTVSSVLSKGFFARFLERYPDPASIVDAPEAELLSVWEGLGYYSRVRNLQKAGRAIVEQFGGRFPDEVEEILKLPGVGRYTAGAVASFAFGKSAPIVDGNVARVFSRLMDFCEEIDSPAGQKQLWAWAEALVPAEGAREYNSAIMELGQTHCGKGVPDCLECPVARFCRTREPEALPVKKPRVKMTEVLETVAFAQRENGAVLMAPEGGTRRKGMWKLPERPAEGEILHEMKYVITRYKVQLQIYALVGEAQGDECWIAESDLAELPMGAPYRKALNHLLAER